MDSNQRTLGELLENKNNSKERFDRIEKKLDSLSSKLDNLSSMQWKTEGIRWVIVLAVSVMGSAICEWLLFKRWG